MNAPVIALLARRRKRQSGSNVDAFEMLAEAFRQHFSLSKRTVRWLCDELRDELGWWPCGISVEDQVLCTLPFFAIRGFQPAVGSEEKVSLWQASVSRFIHTVAKAITQ